MDDVELPTELVDVLLSELADVALPAEDEELVVLALEFTELTDVLLEDVVEDCEAPLLAVLLVTLDEASEEALVEAELVVEDAVEL
ncbi:MAG: hypothetical protein Q7R81_02555 [Candidatus Peregrinibacteria bacterium]|nr:hypothetical protein [Candidatus Peregrinibacteria bacterium]